MRQQISAHLSEEAFDDLLIGLGSAESEAHMATCDICRQQFVEFRLHVKTFNQASLAWVESKIEQAPEASRGLALRMESSKSGQRRLFIPRMSSPFGWAVATVLLLALGLQVWNRERQSSLSANGIGDHTTQTSAQIDSEAQIAQDNQLLQSVNLALTASETSPLQDFGLENELRPRPQSHTQPRSKVRHR